MKRSPFTTKVFILTALMLALAGGASHAQRLTHLWPGLRQKQPQAELPKGNAPAQESERVAKRPAVTTLAEAGRGEWVITGGWEMTDAATLTESGKSVFDISLDTDGWYNATVPGTVLTTLVEQGVYPDPYYGLNNMAIPESLCRTDWWYRCVFEMPAGSDGERARLLFNGINYMAEIFLNGKKLGNIEGAFIRGEFDVTDLVRRTGSNVLAVRIIPPRNPGIPHEQSMVAGQGLNGGALSLDGPTFISSVGWDWIPGIRDRNAGIWQDVRLLTGGDVVIGDPLIITRLPQLPDTSRATVAIRTDISNRSDREVSGTLRAGFDGVTVEKTYTLAAGETRELYLSPEEFPQLNIKKPRLWWPNGYGAQELYDMDITVSDGDRGSDSRRVRFGIRELSYELMAATADRGNLRIAYTPVDNMGGEPVFDFVNRVHYDRYNQLATVMPGVEVPQAVGESRRGIELLPQDDPVGPYIVIRVNGERIFCRGGNWGMDDGMKRVGRERLEPYVRLHKEANFNIIRNWTGESTEEVFYELCDEYGMLVWNDFWITTDDTVEPNDTELFLRNAGDVVKRFRNHPSIAVWGPRNEGFAPAEMAAVLPEMIAREDPTRHYHGQSRFLNMDTSGPWGYFKDPAKYYTDNAKGFITEIGTYAVPTEETIRKFIPQEDLWPINDVWAYHDMHHTTQNFPDFIQAVSRYGEPRSMEEFARNAQLVCYDAWRAIMEAWNSRMWNNTTGQILWMSHPAWPSMIWQTYSYDYETPGSFFGAKKASEPLHVQMNLHDRKVVILNNTREVRRKLSVTLTITDMADGREVYRHADRFDAPANSLTECFTMQTPAALPEVYMVRVQLADGRNVVSVNDYILSGSDSFASMGSMPKAELRLTENTRKGVRTVEVQNLSDITAVGVKLNARDTKTGQAILPAYFSDGYINLLPGEKRTVELSIPERHGEYIITASGFNL